MHAVSTPLACAADVMLVNSLNIALLIGMLEMKLCLFSV